MWKQIWEALKGTDDLAEMIAKVGEMLENGKWMFEQASDALVRKADWAGIADRLYPRDQRINEAERNVRERVVTHMSVGHQIDLSACLILMNVVKDAERIGDYCKNIFEVGKFYEREYAHPEYAKPLEEIREKVLPLFDKAKEAFTDADRDKANVVLDAAVGLTRECDLLIRQLLSVREKLAPDEAVAYVLLARFYKRVAAHLSNIATSVVSPVAMLDYHHKNLKE